MVEGSEIAIIGYHINDIYANTYSNARAEYYNMVGLPHVVIDGTQTFDVTYDAMLEEYNERIVLPSNYSISMDATRNGTVVNASVNVGQLGAPNPETKVLHMVLTESHIPETWYGGDEVSHVERLMIPDQNGTPIVSDKGIKDTFDFEFEMEPSWALQNCELVAFLQDTTTREIMQAEIFPLEQIVTYNDAAIADIFSPGENYCNDVMTPMIEIENYGIDELLSCFIEYSINGQSFNYTWNGELDNYESELVELPAVSITLEEDNNITVELSQPNGQPDESPENNLSEKNFELAP